MLEPADAVVLDASPIFDGFVVDTSRSWSYAPTPEHTAAMADDLVYRTTILDTVRAGATFREIALAVDADMTRVAAIATVTSCTPPRCSGTAPC